MWDQRGAAGSEARTWLGRLGYNHLPRESQMTIPKDHEFSRRLLEHHVAHARSLEASP